MIKGELSKDNFNEDNLIFVNVWKYAQFCDEKNIARAVLSGMLSELKPDDKVKEIFKNVWRVFGTVAAITLDSAIGGKAGDVAGKLTDLTNEEPTIEKLQDAIKECINKLAGDKGRVVFFIDDLDRLKPVQAIEVLEIIKNYLDIERCVFVLAIDYDVIIDGVKEKYGNDFSTKKAHQFFEKIIQVPFKLPKQGYEITDYLKIFSASKNVDENIKLILENSVGKNPRAIKRAMNILNLTKLINAKENDDDKILAIICLQLCYNEIYDEMLKNPDEWQEAFSMKTEDFVDERFIEMFIDLFENDKNNKIIKELLELTKVTDFERVRKIENNKEYYMKINIVSEDTKFSDTYSFCQGGRKQKGIPALNYLIINAYKDNKLKDWYKDNVSVETDIEKLKGKGLNKYWLFDEGEKGKTFDFNKIPKRDSEILKILKNELREKMEIVLFGTEEEAKNSLGINISEEIWNYFDS